MATWGEVKTAVLKGVGFWPTQYLLRWSPSPRSPFRFDLVEVNRCDTDDMVVTANASQETLKIHAGHRIKSPKRYTFWEFLKVQLRIIK